MRALVLLLAAALLAGCNAPEQSRDDAIPATPTPQDAAAQLALPADACVPVGSWRDPTLYEALGEKEGVEQRAPDDLLASAPGDPGARVTYFGWERADGLAFWLRSNATVVWIEGRLGEPEASREDASRAFDAFAARMTPADEAARAAWFEEFWAQKRVRIDAPLRIEDAWQELGPPEPEGNAVRWREEGATWEARWERAIRQWRVDTPERPLVLRAELAGRASAYSDVELADRDAQPWLAQALARNGLPPPEFEGWVSGAGGGTRPAC